MKTKSLCLTTLACLPITLFAQSNTTGTGQTVPVTEQTRKPAPRVQLALLLDTSGSMSGLINQARTQLWRVVNEFIAAKRDGQTPEVEVALYEYGNSGLEDKATWIRCIVPLSRDLDKVSQELFALSTNGGEDVVTVRAAPSSTTTRIATGGGADAVVLLGLTVATAVDLGDGDDEFRVHADTAGSRLTVLGGTGADALYLDQLGNGAAVEASGGAGPDTFLVAGLGLPASAVATLHGDVAGGDGRHDCLRCG